MNFNYTRALLRLTTTLIKYDKKVTFNNLVTRSVPNFITVRSRFFSDKPEELYAVLDKDDFEEEDGSNYTEVNFEKIAEGNPETLRLLKLYQLEIDFLAYKGGEVPNKITESHWRDLLLINSKTKRARYLSKLWKNEKFRSLKKRIQDEKRKKLEEFRLNNPAEEVQLSTNSPLKYGLARTTIFFRFYPKTINNLYNFRIMQAMMFGPHIIVDCGYDKYMSHKDILACAAQLVELWLINRENFNPFDIIFCNLNTNSVLYSKLLERFPMIKEDPTCPFNLTDKSYLDLYPKEQLVYLTPNASNIMEEYEHDSIYIIGGFVDPTNEERLSLAKAKQDGLRMAKFPIDKHLKWATGKKILTMSQCFGIMTDLKDGGDWNLAFRHIPSFKVRQFNASSNDEANEMKTWKLRG